MSEPVLQVFSNLRTANVARQADWCPDQTPDLSFRGNELAGEVGEACNVIKKLERERLGWAGSRDTVEHLAEELADIVICTDLVAASAGIDLDVAVAAKFNATSEKMGHPQRYRPSPSSGEVSRAALDVLAERRRQTDIEGWTADHDDRHDQGEIEQAAAAYAFAASGRRQSHGNLWPWDAKWWKPGSPRRMLVKAGALIIAAIERIDRLEMRETSRD